MSDDERRKLLSTDQGLGIVTDEAPKIPTAIEGLETFSLSDDAEEEAEDKLIDADSLFNLPEGEDEDEQP